jgi:NADH-quinone oxidoreductase subunit N
MNAIQSFPYIYPEIILVAGGLLLILLDLFVANKKMLGYGAIAILLASLLPLNPYTGGAEVFNGMFIVDRFASYFKIFSVLVVALITLISLDYKSLMDKYRGEYYALLVFLALGMMLMASAANLLMLQLSIEMVSLTSYLLVAFNKKDARSSEAALKYYLFGCIASGVMLYGMTYLYGLTGSLNYADIFAYFRDGTADSVVILVFMLMILAGLGFKIAMVPFHWWVPDTYEGAPTPITAFLSVGSKAVGFSVLYRIFLMVFPAFYSDWSNLLGVLAIVTMTIGNIVAVSQTNLKRLLAYSSIAHAGYILVGVSIGYTNWAQEAILIYLLTYYLMNLGAFIILIIVSNTLDSDELEDYSGLSQRAPALAFCFALFLLSLTGVPPLAGFFGKYYIFAAAIEAGSTDPFSYWLAVAIAVNSVIAAFYYFRIIRQMYLVDPEDTGGIKQPATLKFALGLMVFFTVTLSLYLSPIAEFIRHTSAMLTWY